MFEHTEQIAALLRQGKRAESAQCGATAIGTSRWPGPRLAR